MISHWKQVSIQAVLAAWFTDNGGGSAPGASEKPEARLPADQYRAAIEPFLLFLRFLPHCDWYRIRLNDVEDLMALQLIHEESWLPPQNGAKRVLGHCCRDDCVPAEHEEKARALAERADVRSLLDGRMILFGHAPDEPLSILDGNHRALAYARNLVRKPQAWSPVEAYVGISLGPCRWHGDAVSWIERPPREAGERRYVLNIW